MNNNTININGNNNIVAGGDIIVKNIQRLPSLLGSILPSLIEAIDTFDESKQPPSKPYEIDNKINFNNLYVYKNSIEKYGLFGNIIDSIMENLDTSKPMSKKKIFRYLEKKYVDTIANLNLNNQSKIEIIKIKSDDIFKKTMSQINDDLKGADTGDVSMEDLEICILVITCYGFINCKIMENVPDDY